MSDKKLGNFIGLQQECINCPKISELPQTSRRQKGAMKQVSYLGPTHTLAPQYRIYSSRPAGARNLYTPGKQHKEELYDLVRSHIFATTVKSTKLCCFNIWLGYEKTRIKKKMLGNSLVKRLYDNQETDRKIILRLMLGK